MDKANSSSRLASVGLEWEKFNCFNPYYLVEVIFGEFAGEPENQEYVLALSTAIRYQDPALYKDAGNLFRQAGKKKIGNHLDRIALGIERQRKRLYAKNNRLRC